MDQTLQEWTIRKAFGRTSTPKSSISPIRARVKVTQQSQNFFAFLLVNGQQKNPRKEKVGPRTEKELKSLNDSSKTTDVTEDIMSRGVYPPITYASQK